MTCWLPGAEQSTAVGSQAGRAVSTLRIGLWVVARVLDDSSRQRIGESSDADVRTNSTKARG